MEGTCLNPQKKDSDEVRSLKVGKMDHIGGVFEAINMIIIGQDGSI